MTTPDPVAAAITRAARTDAARVLALLAHRFDDLELADEAVQEALVRAVTDWPRTGVPDNPAGWLMTVARNRAIDRLRRRAATRRREQAVAADLVEATLPADERALIATEEGEATMAGDERLRLMLLCCHPALAPDAQVALTLRLVAGLTTAEIASGLLVAEATVSQRILRAKQKIRTAGIPLSMPAALDERVGVLLRVLYLVFNEGYLSHGVRAVRVDLADEAIRLTDVVADLLPDDPEVAGLAALMAFHRARFATRVDADGELVPLEHQDRDRWDRAAILAASRSLTAAVRAGRAGPFQVQALVAGIHAMAPTYAATDWAAIVHAYDTLMDLTGAAPVVRLNRAVALGMAEGPESGLAALAGIPLPDHHLLVAARGDLLERLDDPRAASEFERAADLAPDGATARLLRRRAARARGAWS